MKRPRAILCARWRSASRSSSDPGFRAFEALRASSRCRRLYVLDEHDRIVRQEPGFDKTRSNEIAALFGHAPVATPVSTALRRASRDARRGIWKCRRRRRAPRRSICIRSAAHPASMIELGEGEDPIEYCYPGVRRRSAGGAAHAWIAWRRCCAAAGRDAAGSDRAHSALLRRGHGGKNRGQRGDGGMCVRNDARADSADARGLPTSDSTRTACRRPRISPRL